MTFGATLKLGLALVAGLTLSACGSEPKPVITLLKQLPAHMGKKDGGDGSVTPDQMAGILNATDAPVELFQFEARKAQFMMLEIERNGAYRSYGSPTRQGIVLRDGMIVATRGFGGDLMNVEEDALLRLVQSRQPGTAPYQQRFLTSEDVTETRSYSCETSIASQPEIALGEVKTSGTIVNALCRGEGVKFTNLYIVEKSGQIMTGRSWLGFEIGYVTNQALRR